MKFTVDITPVISHIRVYGEGDSYLARSPYQTIITVQHLPRDAVYLSGAHGTLTREIVKEIGVQLKAQGIKLMSYERDRIIMEVEL